MHVATTRPTQPEPAWASVMTGKWPAAHGVRGAAVYRPYGGDVALEVLPDYLFSQALVRFGFLVAEPHTSRSLHAQPLWQILGRQGMRSGIIGLPLTHPARPMSGFLVSDRFHGRAGRRVELDAQPAAYPPAVADMAQLLIGADDGQAAARPVRLDRALQPPERDAALAADRLHHQLAMQLGAAGDVRLLAVRYPGLDTVGHYYLRYAGTDAIGNVTDEDRRAYGRVVDDYYAYVDSLIGDALELLREGDVLFVVSAFGMEPLTVGKRVLERVAGDPRFSGTHERAPDGFLLAFGAPVAAGRLTRGAVVDIVPTLLYFLGLPVARDMHGFARTDLFSGAFNAPRTITFIPSYERGPGP
jgi:predicted AlkP superfamily pyrophosphatase or phosphodiesterase